MTPSSNDSEKSKAARRRALGQAGEDAAAAFLSGLGYDILVRNYRAPGGELDVVARDGDCVVFVEVKTGRAGAAVDPRENYTPRKAARVFKAAISFLQEREPLPDPDFRFDLLIVAEKDGRYDVEHHAGIPLDQYFPRAFGEGAD